MGGWALSAFRRIRWLPVPQHLVSPGRTRAVAAARRSGDGADGADDPHRLADIRTHGRAPRPAAAARDRRGLHADRLRPAGRRRRRRPRSLSCWPSTSCSGLGSGSSTCRSRTPPCPECRVPRPASASAIASGSRQVGHTLGVAVVGAIIASQLGASGHADPSAASRPAWWTLDRGAAASYWRWAFVATDRRASESARRTAAELNPEALPAQVLAG